MWLLLEKTYAKLEAATKAGYEATKENAIKISAFIGWELSDIFTVSDTLGMIDIVGVLTSEPDPFAAIFADGNTTYSAIIQAIEAAENDENVKEIVLRINSPGGDFEGMLEAMEAIRTATKPTRAEVRGMAASAAFGLAASADEIVALSKSTQFGSVGVVVDFRIREDVVSLTNTGSPNKRPDPATAEGRAVIQTELDAAFDLFAEAIAESMDIEPSEVAEKFGKGATFFAEQAIEMGMVDTLKKSSQNTGQSSSPSKGSKDNKQSKSNKTQGVQMDLATLKKDHPELVSEIEASVKPVIPAPAAPAPVAPLDADDPVALERERVNAHLELGEESGDMKYARECIADGTGITAIVNMRHMKAFGKKAAIDSRQGDDVNLDDPGSEEEKEKTAASNILKTVANNLNVKG